MPDSRKAELNMAGLSTASPSDYCLVMLIDDQRIVALGLRKIIENEPDIDMHYCPTGKEAVRSAILLEPTVICLDLVMADMDGMEVLRALRKAPELNSVPIIMLSSEEDPTVKADAFELGANDYITKWPDPVELLARLRHHSEFCRSSIALDEAIAHLRKSQTLLTEKNIELERLATHDNLTGLNNRRALNTRIDEEMRRSVRNGKSLGLLMLDIDYFKRFNDHYGHLAGDDCLRVVSRTLVAGARRPSDYCARYGGEEFLIILPDASIEGAITVAKTIQSNLASQEIVHEYSSVSDFVTLSIGISVMQPDRESTTEGLISFADDALYAAKKAGRNQIKTAQQADD